jgi:hypothetical protein
VVKLLLGVEVAGASIAIARVAGIGLISLGVGCWLGRQEESSGWALVAMLLYNVLVTVYLAFVGIGTEFVGRLLWPAVVVHAVLTGLLAYSLVGRQAKGLEDGATLVLMKRAKTVNINLRLPAALHKKLVEAGASNSPPSSLNSEILSRLFESFERPTVAALEKKVHGTEAYVVARVKEIETHAKARIKEIEARADELLNGWRAVLRKFGI